MIVIDEIALEESILQRHFACDLGRCQGACCTIPGGRGAPLADDEVDSIIEAYPSIKKYLPPEHLAVIETKGMVEGTPGNYATVCVGQRACVFVCYEGKIAKCAFERAYLNRETSWRKPQSCHLFPIRIRTSAPTTLRYEPLEECHSAESNGVSSGVSLVGFLHESLQRAFGAQWVAELKKVMESQPEERNRRSNLSVSHSC